MTWRLEYNCTINLGTIGVSGWFLTESMMGGISVALAEEHFLFHCLSELSHLQPISVTVMYCN